MTDFDPAPGGEVSFGAIWTVLGVEAECPLYSTREGPVVRIRLPPAASRTNVDRGAHRLGIEPRKQNLRDAALEDKIVERAMVPSAKG